MQHWMIVINVANVSQLLLNCTTAKPLVRSWLHKTRTIYYRTVLCVYGLLVL